MDKLARSILAALALALGGAAPAADRHWRGTDADSPALASVAANWAEEAVPATGDAIILDADSANAPMTWDVDDVTPASWTQTADYGGTVTFQTGLSRSAKGTAYVAHGVLATDGVTRVLKVSGDVTVNGGTWTHTVNPAMNSSDEAWTDGKGIYRLIAEIGGDYTLGVGASNVVSSCGYASYNGPGTDVNRKNVSASYGGMGSCVSYAYDRANGGNERHCYGSIKRPVSLGSGGSGKVGGGAIILTVAGDAVIAGKNLALGGGEGSTCNASGGTVSITAATLALTGEVSADGGNATNYGGGAGGRIALIVTGSGADFSGITRTLLHAYAGYHSSWSRCGNGTVYFETAADAGRGELYLNANGAAYDAGYAAGIEGDSTDNDFSKISFANKGALTIMPGAVLKADALDGTADTTTKGIYLAGGTLASTNAELSAPGVTVLASPRRPTQYGHIGNAGTIKIKDGAGAFVVDGTKGGKLQVDCPFTVDCNLILTNAGKVVCCSGGTMTTVYSSCQSGSYALPGYTNMVEFTVTGDMRLESGTQVTVAGLGYGVKSGPGAPLVGDDYNGAAHGGRPDGRGQSTATIDPSTLPLPYDSIYEPLDRGSGGSSTSGGGIIRLTVNGKLDVDGTITAAGGAAGAGPGAGGSVLIVCGELVSRDKTGSINADAGTCTVGGFYTGSGGGRVAIRLTKPGATFADFGSVSNRLTAYGSKMQWYSGQWGWTRFGSPGTVYLRTASQDLHHGTLLIQHGTYFVKKTKLATDIIAGVEGREFGDVVLMDNATLRLGEDETISVNGGWSSDATSVLSNETGAVVVFTGEAVATLSGSNWFRNVSCTVPGKTFKFATALSCFGILPGGSLTLAGEDTAEGRICLRSESDGTEWPMYFSPGAVASVDGVDVKDAHNYGASVLATHSVDSENNTGWKIVGEIVGGDNYWTGATGADWDVGDNWSLERVPISDDHVFVNTPDGMPNPTLGSTLVLKGLTVSAGSTLTVNGELTVTNAIVVTGALRGSGTLTIAGVSANLGDADVAMTGTLAVGGGSDLTLDLDGDTVGTFSVARTGGTLSLPHGVASTRLRMTGRGTLEVGAGQTLAASDVRIDGFVDDAAAITLRGADDAVWNLDATTLVLVNGVAVGGSRARVLPVVATSSSNVGAACENWSFSGRQCSWTGGAGTTDWATAENWEGGAPQAGDIVLLPDEASVVASVKASFHSLIAEAASVTFKGGFAATGAIELQDGAVMASDAPSSVAGLFTVHAGATLTHSSNTSAQQKAGVTNALDVTCGSDMTVEAGATINVLAKGYADRTGPGSPSKGNVGGGYGGISGNANDGGYVRDCYGSIRKPVHLGSGASTLGGGAVKLAVAGTLTLNGDVICRGGYCHQYSGSGGSVYLTCGKLVGSGTIDANAGHYYGGAWAGGGGRVAVWLTDPAARRADFTGTISTWGCLYATANGAISYPPRASCGTVFWHEAADAAADGGYVLIDGNWALKHDSGSYIAYNLRTEVPAKGVGADGIRDFRKTSFRVERYGTMYLSHDLTVYDIDFGSGGRIRLNGHVLKVLSAAHKDRKGWANKSPELVSTVSGDVDAAGGEIRWVPKATVIILR